MQGWRSFLRAHAQIVYKIPSHANWTSSSLLGIPAFDRIAGLYNRHLNPNSEYAYANDEPIAPSNRLRHCRNAAVMSLNLNPSPYFLIWASTGGWPISTLAGGRVLDRVFLGSRDTQMVDSYFSHRAGVCWSWVTQPS